MERFKLLGSEPAAHKSGIWALTPIPHAQRSDMGQFLTGGSDGRLRSWNFANPLSTSLSDEEDSSNLPSHPDSPLSPLRTFSRHSLPVVRVAVAANQPVAASTSLDGFVRVWNLASDDAQATVIQQQSITDAWDIAVVADGSRAIVCGAHATVQIVDCTGSMMEQMYLSGGEGQREGPMAMALALRDDDALVAVASADGSVNLIDVETQKSVATTKRKHGGPVRAIAFLPGDRDTILTASDDHLINLYDVASGEITGTCRGHDGYVLSIGASPDGRYLVSGGADNTVRVWDRGLREQIFVQNAHKQEVWGSTFVGSDRIVSVSDDGNICVMDSTNADVVS